MTQPLARLYGSQDTATAVKTELQKGGLAAGQIHIVTRADADGGATVADAIAKTGVPPAHAALYAEDIVRRGQALVVAQTHFGRTRAAEKVMDRFEPIHVDVPEVELPSTAAKGRDNAAPLSSALGWKVLSSDPTPLSNYLKWAVLKPQPATSPTLERVRAQSGDAAPFSRKIGMAVLSDNPAPLSTKLGWSLLSGKAAPLSEKLGWRVLSDDPAPLSRKLGWGLLSSKVAPLSDRLGWRVLSENPTPSSAKPAPKLLHDDTAPPAAKAATHVDDNPHPPAT